MAPSVWLTICATPGLPCPACVSDAQSALSPLPSVQSLGATAVRNLVKLLVVPELSARRATVIDVDGNVAPGLSALIAGSSPFLIFVAKILASVASESCSLLTPESLYEIVIGAATVGK